MVVQQKIDVYTTVDGKSALSGALFAGGGSLTFRYDSGYLENRNAYDLAPYVATYGGVDVPFRRLGAFFGFRSGQVGSALAQPRPETDTCVRNGISAGCG